MTTLPLLRLAAAGLLLLAPWALGCETPRRPSAPMSWDQTAPTLPTQTASPRKVTAREAAEEFTSAAECEATARRLSTTDPKRAQGLVRACVQRADFFDLPLLLRSPWVEGLRQGEAELLMLAELVAKRGGDVQGDVSLCREAGLPVIDVDMALADPKGAKGNYLFIRGSVDEVTKKKGRVVGSLRETSWLSGTELAERQRTFRSIFSSRTFTFKTFDLKNRNRALPTGRRITLALEKPEPAFKAERQLVVVARLVSVLPRADLVRVGYEDEPDPLDSSEEPIDNSDVDVVARPIAWFDTSSRLRF